MRYGRKPIDPVLACIRYGRLYTESGDMLIHIFLQDSLGRIIRIENPIITISRIECLLLLGTSRMRRINSVATRDGLGNANTAWVKYPDRATR
jgi:hypothetical protein